MSAVKSVETDNVGKPTACLGVRHAQAALLFLAMLLAYSMRVNISMAIVAMTDPASEDSFSWSVQKQSVILSSFFWGYVVLQVPAGEVAARWGGKLPVALVVGVNSLVCLVLPLAAYYGGWAAVCACRVVQGLFQGLLFPSTHSLMSKWIPLEEKSRLGTIIYAGAHIGTGLQLMAAGFTASYLGWAAIFYINGSLGAAWTALYLLYGAASPDDSRSISEEERTYIQNSLGQVKGEKKVPTPWRSILTSLPFWALLVVHCGQNWGFWTLMTEMPSYMSQVLGVNIKANGVMSALPYLAMYLMSLPFGFLSDHILARGWLSVSVTRKLFNTIGLWGPALALIGLSYAPAGDVTVAVACLTVTVALNAGHIMGFLLVHLDLAPRHAGSLMGVTNCVSNIVSIVAPLAAGAILQDETDPADWRKVFYLASLVYLLSNGFFLIFGTSERQRWNDPPTQEGNETSTQHASGKVV
ncbi:putative inorganic phosphate cotransporter isoform X1 [Plutella xylostella]|uniref:putative inorganic phosphate cotransporter isoform X1 n=1 Tax=Plutella xylostella TaxID=51655 RepID=UPI002033154A|nr:putative inorganic phosphate cotransporter isoform X1 [Plutella xylostella]